MITEFEKHVTDAIVSFYAGDYGALLDYLDENVIWYGPRAGEQIIGKDALLENYRAQDTALRYNVSGISTRLLTHGPSNYLMVASYRIWVDRPDGRREHAQRMIISGQRMRDRDGQVIWRCPFIHVTNLPPTRAKTRPPASAPAPAEVMPVRRLSFPGPDRVTVYLREDSIRYIVGGKKVLCEVHTDRDVYPVRMLLKDIEPLLPDYYYRCHASYIVNLRCVLAISGREVILTDGTRLPIPAKRYHEIKADIDKWMADGK